MVFEKFIILKYNLLVEFCLNINLSEYNDLWNDIYIYICTEQQPVS